jgi:hypothetical protein
MQRRRARLDAMLGNRLVTIHVLLAIVAAACRPPGPRTTPADPPSAKLERLHAVEVQTRDLPEQAHGAAIATAYDEAFAGLTIARVTDDELAAWYRAAATVAFYAHEPVRARILAGLLEALERRGRATDRNYAELYEMYVGARLLDDARALAKRHPLPSAEILPELRGDAAVPPGTPSLWVVDPIASELIARPVALDQAAQVVVVAHPDCHFTQWAAADLEQDPELRAALSTHATWLAPQANHLDVAAIRVWNQAHPGFAISIAAHNRDWPMLDRWATPTFYVLEHGAVVATVQGWPKEGRRAELRAALRRSGLLP